MKPRVIVIRAQGKPLFLHLRGKQFVSAFTWERLVRKHHNNQYRLLTPTLKERLKLWE